MTVGLVTSHVFLCCICDSRTVLPCDFPRGRTLARAHICPDCDVEFQYAVERAEAPGDGVRGGQGRSDDDLRFDATCVRGALVALVSLFFVAWLIAEVLK